MRVGVLGDLSEAKAQPQPADLMPSYPVGKKLIVELSFRFLIPAMLDSAPLCLFRVAAIFSMQPNISPACSTIS